MVWIYVGDYRGSPGLPHRGRKWYDTLVCLQTLKGRYKLIVI